MALIEVSLPPEALEGGQLGPDAALQVEAPGMPTLRVPLQPHTTRAVRNAIVWEWSGQALDEGDDAAAWFSTYLDKPCRLVRFAGSLPEGAQLEDATRAVDPKWAPGHCTAFADGFPFLLASKESMDDFNARLGQQLNIDRFRANIVVSGVSPWAEDKWETVAVGDLQLKGVKPCTRCSMPEVDQQAGTMPATREVTPVLKEFRSGPVLGWTEQMAGTVWRSDVMFGLNCVPADPSGTSGTVVSVGDAVSVGTLRLKWSAAAPGAA